MNRCLTLAAGLALSLTTLVSTAQAVPPIMDRVPSSAAMVIVIPSIARKASEPTAITAACSPGERSSKSLAGTTSVCAFSTTIDTAGHVVISASFREGRSPFCPAGPVEATPPHSPLESPLLCPILVACRRGGNMVKLRR